MLSRMVYRPVGDLMLTMRRIGEGDITAKAWANGGDELRKLSEALNAMVHSLREQHDEIVKARERLLEAKRLASIGVLAAGMAHEINNPIGAIFVAVDGLSRQVQQGSQGAVLLDLIERSARRVSDLVRELLRFDPKQPMIRACLDINELVKEIIASFSGATMKPTHVVTLELEDGPQEVVGDKERIRQAISSIITNAIEAMPFGGTLKVRTTGDESEVEILISDTGEGIAPDDLPFVTDPFFTRKDAGGGRGLGLAIAQEIIAQHGGSLRLSSRLNEGTTAQICIPKRGPESIV